MQGGQGADVLPTSERLGVFSTGNGVPLKKSSNARLVVA